MNFLKSKNFFFYCLYLGLIVFTISGCGSSKHTSSPSSVVEINIPSYNQSALAIINTNLKTYNSGQSIGTLPSALTLLKQVSDSILKPAPCLQFKINPSFTKYAPNFKLQEIESLTENNPTASFKTYNIESESATSPIVIEGTLKYAGTKCLIYVETGYNTLLKKNSNGTETPLSIDWSIIGQLFDSKIYPNETSLFGFPEDVDNNQKVVIFYYKFNRGSLNENQDTGFIAGYVWPYDLIRYQNYYSNQKDIIYMNLTCRTVSQNIETLAHEFQHVLNISERTINRNLEIQDTWINEGMAECGAHIGLNSPLTSQLEAMKTDPYIRNGLIPLIEWSSTAQQYSLSYTFFQYVRLQSIKGNTILANINLHPYGDYRSIESELTTEPNTLFTNFQSILASFHIANIVNQPTGIYGYKNDAMFNNFNNLASPTLSDITLYSGGGVYYYLTQTELQNFKPQNYGKNIIFYKINP